MQAGQPGLLPHKGATWAPHHEHCMLCSRPANNCVNCRRCGRVVCKKCICAASMKAWMVPPSTGHGSAKLSGSAALVDAVGAADHVIWCGEASQAATNRQRVCKQCKDPAFKYVQLEAPKLCAPRNATETADFSWICCDDHDVNRLQYEAEYKTAPGCKTWTSLVCLGAHGPGVSFMAMRMRDSSVHPHPWILWDTVERTNVAILMGAPRVPHHHSVGLWIENLQIISVKSELVCTLWQDLRIWDLMRLKKVRCRFVYVECTERNLKMLRRQVIGAPQARCQQVVPLLNSTGLSSPKVIWIRLRQRWYTTTANSNFGLIWTMTNTQMTMKSTCAALCL